MRAIKPLLLRHFQTRMVGWAWVTLFLLIAIGVTAPQQLPVSLYKLSLITSAAWVGYWIDRSLFPYARPDAFLEGPLVVRKGCYRAFAAAQQRRAIIIAACIIGVALGA